MSATQIVLQIRKDETFKQVFNYLQASNNNPVDLTAYTTVTADFVVGTTLTLTKAANPTQVSYVGSPSLGKLQVILTTAQIAAFTSDRGRFRLIVQNPSASPEDIDVIVDALIEIVDV